MKLDAYIRVSQVRGRNGDSFISPEQQKDKITQWATLRGVQIGRWHTDLDQSGGKLTRPAFDQVLDRVRAGDTGGIVVAKLDRFSRAGVADALKLIEAIEDAGGQVASVEEGVDPTTPFGEFARTIFVALARMQRQQIKANWKDAQRRAVERGIHVAPKSPTGYVRGPDGRLLRNPEHPDWLDHVAEVFAMRIRGATWKQMALYLREHNVQSPYGTTNWQPRALSHMISNRAYLGEARSGEYTHPDAHEAIIDEATFAAAQEDHGPMAVGNMGGSLMARLLRCDTCGYVLKPDTMKNRQGEKVRLYRCRTERSSGRCPAPASVLGSVIEPYVVSEFMARLKGLRAEGVQTAAELEQAQRTVEAARRELDTYLTAVSAADVGEEAFAKGARQRREAADRAREQLVQVRDAAGLADLPDATTLEQDWPNMTTRERNELLRAGLVAVRLRKGRDHISERTDIEWKRGYA